MSWVAPMTMSRVKIGAVIVAAVVAVGMGVSCSPPAPQPLVAPLASTGPTATVSDVGTESDAIGRGPVAVIPPLGTNGFALVPTGPALDLLDRLAVDDTPSPVPYSRARFGPGWADPDGNGCTGREEAIIDWATPDSVRQGPGCRIEAVTLTSLYDGIEIVAATSGDVAQLIQVDHIVSVKDAFRQLCCVTGPDAQRLRVLFYNDPENLRPVSSAANQHKSDYLFGDNRFSYVSDAAACFVADHTVRVKTIYGLSVASSELVALRERLANCEPSS